MSCTDLMTMHTDTTNRVRSAASSSPKLRRKKALLATILSARPPGPGPISRLCSCRRQCFNSI